MNGVMARGATVNGPEFIGELAGGATVIALAMAATPKGRDARRRAKQRRADLDGRPPRIEDGREVEPGRPSLASAVHQLTVQAAAMGETVQRIDAATQQLARNDGSTIADAIHRIEGTLAEKHAENQAGIAELRATAEANSEALVDVQRMAGAAAAAAATAEQRAGDTRAQMTVLTDVVTQDASRIWSALAQLGIDRRDPR